MKLQFFTLLFILNAGSSIAAPPDVLGIFKKVDDYLTAWRSKVRYEVQVCTGRGELGRLINWLNDLQPQLSNHELTDNEKCHVLVDEAGVQAKIYHLLDEHPESRGEVPEEYRKKYNLNDADQFGLEAFKNVSLAYKNFPGCIEAKVAYAETVDGVLHKGWLKAKGAPLFFRKKGVLIIDEDFYDQKKKMIDILAGIFKSGASAFIDYSGKANDLLMRRAQEALDALKSY